MNHKFLAVATLGAAVLSTQPLNAASIYWNGVGNGWDTVADWSTASGATTPPPAAVPGSSDTAIFNISTVTAAQTVNLNANQAVLGLQFLATATGAVTLNSGTGVNTLTIGTGGITIATGAAAPVFNAGIVLNGNQTWANSASGAPKIGAVTGTGNLTMTGNYDITTASLATTGTLAINNTAEWYPAFINGASGGVTSTINQLGLHGVFTVDKSIAMSAGGVNWYTNGSNQILSGAFSGSISMIGSGDLTLSGITDNALTLSQTPTGITYLAKTSNANVHAIGSQLTLVANSTTKITGTGGDQIKDTANVTINAGATFDLNGNSETIANLTENATGIVTNSAAATSSTLTVGAGNGSSTASGVIQNGAGTVGLTKRGTGTLTLTGANTYTGTTAANRGTLLLDYSVLSPASVVSSSSALALGGGILSVKGKATGTTSQTFNGLTMNSGASGITVNANGGTGTVVALGAITRNPGSTVNFTLPTGTQSATNGVTTAQTNLGTTILSGWATVAGTDWASASAGNIISASAAYTNNTWSAGTNTTMTTSSAPSASSTTNSLRFASGAQTVTLSGTNTITTGGILVSSGIGNNASTITGGSLTSGDGEAVYINQFNTTNTPGLTIASAIVNNGATPIAITKAGTGAVTLSGTNTTTGALNVNAGTVNLSGTNASISAVNVNSGTLNLSGATALTSAAPVNISSGGTVNVASSSTLGDGTSAVTLSTGSTLTFANTGSAVTLPTGAVSWQSSSNWRGTPDNLGNNISYQVGANGGVVNGAQPDFILIDLGADYALGQLQVTFANTYRNLQFYTAPSSVGSFSSLFVANGNSAASPSTLNLGLFTADSANFVSATDPANGAASFGLSGVTGQYLVMYVTQRHTNNYGFDISALSLTQVAGVVSKSIGSLSSVDANSTVSLALNLTLSTGSNNTSTAYAGVLTGSGALVKTGSGTQTLSNANTYTGGTTISQGSVKVTNITGSATGSGAVLVNGGTLTGNGIISGTITLTSGTIAPGDGLGTLSGSILVWNGGAGMTFDLSNVSNASDKLTLTGALTKGTGSGFNFDFSGTGMATTYTLATFGSTTFNQSDFTYSNLGFGYTGNFVLTGSSLSFTVVAVPEPSDYGMAIGLLLGGCVFLRHRRVRARA